MRRDEARIFSTAQELGAAFDRSFADVHASTTGESQDFLAIRMGADPLALRRSDLAALYRERKIVPVPSPTAELLGITALRGTLAPVYSLALLLGYPKELAPTWMVRTRSSSPVCLAFETFESYARVEAQLVSTKFRHIIDIGSLLEIVSKGTT